MDGFHMIPNPTLVVCAHPDDIEVHCGGTVARLIAEGKQVSCVLCTSGNRGTDDASMTMERIAEIREAEQRAASTALGVQDLTFLRYDDGDLAFNAQRLREDIVRIIRECRPRAVITHDPFPGNGGLDSCSIYPDHVTVGYVTFQAAFVCAPGPLFYPEQLRDGLEPHKPEVIYLIMSDSPDLFVDIGDIWATKWAALEKHRSQGRHLRENEEAMLRIAKENGDRSGLPLAEAFRTLLPT